ncbi:MAG TPA: 3-methyl-2-oxobutanoate dehydrogenase subunit VorB [Planctomycetota bacterium]|nr:3-methyl-2-oxobutanoate dehydrogenase subunit VorB [Planctomycetota bacterium]
MAQRVFMAGNEAAGEGAIQAGCLAYYGYPITPQNELTGYMAQHMPAKGRVFLQAESELAAVNMVLGSSAAGIRAMTSSSSPGISLKQEGISYLAAMELPAVIVNVQRGGPGLGNIAPGQADYWQATRGGGHGDYRCIVLAPYSVQEMFTIVSDAFDLADKYRMVVMVLADGRLGQMMEPVDIPDFPAKPAAAKPWALDGCAGRPARKLRSLFLNEDLLEELNLRLQETYRQVEASEVRFEETATDDADVVMVAYGTCARVCKEALREARKQGMKAGLIRPITLWPFPKQPFRAAAARGAKFLVVEMSAGQMIDDVRLALDRPAEVRFYGRMGGNVPEWDAAVGIIREMIAGRRTGD